MFNIVNFTNLEDRIEALENKIDKITSNLDDDFRSNSRQHQYIAFLMILVVIWVIVFFKRK